MTTHDPVGDGLLVATVVLAFGVLLFVLDAGVWLVRDLTRGKR